MKISLWAMYGMESREMTYRMNSNAVMSMQKRNAAIVLHGFTVVVDVPQTHTISMEASQMLMILAVNSRRSVLSVRS